jgi:acetylornithine deacetylase/succinyl-diaminopimelate desuccinylase-like protein
MSIRSGILLLCVLPLAAQQGPYDRLSRDIFEQLININTTDSSGDNTRAAEAIAARFRQAGYPDNDVQLFAPAPRKGNLVVRLRGTDSARPVLFIGHLDVVEARRSDWSFDPFQFREQDGYFFGRGTQDMKGADTELITAFLRMKREGFRPSRDLILALTSDEEGGTANGVEWLVRNHRDLIDAAYCINADSGGGHIKNGKRAFMGVQAAEKVFLSFTLEVTNPGGHSSLPRKDNAIYHLAAGLTRLAAFDFPVQLFDVTRAYFERMSTIYSGQVAADMKAVAGNPDDTAAVARLSADPYYNALLRTTCVATMLSGGHAENALPQTAKTVVNCRLLPVDNAANVEATLSRVLADAQIHLSVLSPAKPSPFAPMNPDVLGTVTKASESMWPGVRVIPVMETGATDSLYLRIAGMPCYGVDGLFIDEDDVRAHGRDERLPVQSFYEGVEFMYRFVSGLAK